MDRKFMFMEKHLSPGGCLPLPWGYIHVYDHNIQTLMEETYWEYANGQKIYVYGKKFVPRRLSAPAWCYIHVYDHNIQTSTSLKPLYQ